MLQFLLEKLVLLSVEFFLILILDELSYHTLWFFKIKHHILRSKDIILFRVTLFTGSSIMSNIIVDHLICKKLIDIPIKEQFLFEIGPFTLLLNLQMLHFLFNLFMFFFKFIQAFHYTIWVKGE